MNLAKMYRLPAVLVLPLILGISAADVCAGTNLDLARQLNQAFADVVQKASPSVVVITVTEKTPQFSSMTNSTDGKDGFDSLSPEWREFHRHLEDQVPEVAGGSGVIIRKDGYILTNRHVVENAQKVQVQLWDGRVFDGTIRGTDFASDVAVIKIKANDLPVAALGDSSKTRVGEFAIAIGSPFSYDYSVTFGHVSGKNRSNVIPYFQGGNSMDQEYIQTDASINPGNSGGPLLNLDGEVIGINTVIRGLRTGIGFAVPINLAKEIAGKLIADGKVNRGWLGIGIAALKDNLSFRELYPAVTNGVICTTGVARWSVQQIRSSARRRHPVA